MNFVDILRDKIKPELNHIYTERPQQGFQGLDPGWFCREHALHVYGLAVLMGKRAEICVGDYILHRPDGDSWCSVGDSSDHAWCSINGHSPVDISMTVKHIYPDLLDVSLVYGNRTDLSAGFGIENFIDAQDSDFMQLTHHKKKLIAYNEKERIKLSLLELLSDPFEFLLEPPNGCPTFLDIHGTDVFYAITYHCYRLATENIKPLCRYRTPQSSVDQIMKYNPRSKDTIEHCLLGKD